jgi:hypothetical protein
MKSPESTPNEPVRWHGDLKDDCTARWAGLMLRAEKMNDGDWWWCVYDIEFEGPVILSTRRRGSRRLACVDVGSDKAVISSNDFPGRVRTGGEARQAAEQAAQSYLDRKDRRHHWRPRKKSIHGKKSSVNLWKRVSFGSSKPRPKRRRRQG